MLRFSLRGLNGRFIATNLTKLVGVFRRKFSDYKYDENYTARWRVKLFIVDGLRIF